MQELERCLLDDLRKLGITLDFGLELRTYSSKYYGRYYPSTKKVVLYVYKTKEKEFLYSYPTILEQCLHEVSHHLQWCKSTFVRHKGIMHDEEFYKIYNDLKRRIEVNRYVKETKEIEKAFT